MSAHEDYLRNFRRRVLQDAFANAQPNYWERRARQFERVGNARCDETAQMCHFHAQLLREHPVFPFDEMQVRHALREVNEDEFATYKRGAG